MLGLICGLASEATALRSLPDVLIGLSAASPRRARELARDFVRRGATGLVSFGLAGGLAPDLAPGAIVIGTEVAATDGRWTADETWATRLVQELPAAHAGGVWGNGTIVATARDKRALYQRSRCLVADMESHVVAEVAATASLPFAVLRVVVDGFDVDLPRAALCPLKPDGRIHLPSVLGALARRPWELPSLIRLGMASGKANAALRKAAPALTPVIPNNT